MAPRHGVGLHRAASGLLSFLPVSDPCRLQRVRHRQGTRRAPERAVRAARAAAPRTAGARADARLLPADAVARALCRELSAGRRLHDLGGTECALEVAGYRAL